MSKNRRFPTSFFQNFRDDPLLDDSVGVVGGDSAPEDDRFASLAAVFSSPFGEEVPHPRSEGDGAAPSPDDFQTRDYVVNSIFAPPELRGDAEKTQQQLMYIHEKKDSLDGLREVNALMRRGWRVANAFASGNSPSYKALVLLERPY